MGFLSLFQPDRPQADPEPTGGPPQARTAWFLRRLARRGWRPEGPAHPAEVSAVEEALGVILPSDYRSFLLATGRPSRAAAWNGLWRIDELLSLNRSLPVFQWFQGLIGIGNSGFIVYALDYRQGPVPRLVSVGLSSSETSDIHVEGETFEGWLDRTLRYGP